RVDERPDDHISALLGLARVDVVDVERVVIHGQQAEEVVVGLGHRLRRPVLVNGPDLELLEVATVRMGARCLALGLVGGQLVLLPAHRSPFLRLLFVRPWMLPAGAPARLCRLMDRKRLIQFGFWGVLGVLAAVLLIALISNGNDNPSKSKTAE